MKRVGELLSLTSDERRDLWENLFESIEAYQQEIEKLGSGVASTRSEMEELLLRFDFKQGKDPREILGFVVEGLQRFQVQVSHPRYFGLFNPSPSAMGIAAETLASAFNSQLAMWNHCSFGIAVEQHLISFFGRLFGFPSGSIDGTFTTGGSEANHTALLTALNHSFPSYASQGVRGLPGQPIAYISEEGHHSLLKAARTCGIGTHALVSIPTHASLQIDLFELKSRIQNDRKEGQIPFMIVGTAGTTNAGVVDSLVELARLAREEGLWFHVDAAWGGAAVFLPELSKDLKGIDEADSITFDAHKWLSVPMGGGLFLTRHSDILNRTFQVETAYMPKPSRTEEINPFSHSLQWSRRFIGLKVFMTLAALGMEGYEKIIRYQFELGNFFRDQLVKNGWTILNGSTRFPIVCFIDERVEGLGKIEDLVTDVVTKRQAWISTTRISGRTVIRACITNYRTEEKDVELLVSLLNQARNKFF